jgi:hypothetical protein
MLTLVQQNQPLTQTMAQNMAQSAAQMQQPRPRQTLAEAQPILYNMALKISEAYSEATLTPFWHNYYSIRKGSHLGALTNAVREQANLLAFPTPIITPAFLPLTLRAYLLDRDWTLVTQKHLCIHGNSRARLNLLHTLLHAIDSVFRPLDPPRIPPIDSTPPL